MKSSKGDLRILTVASLVVVVLRVAMMVSTAMEPTTMADKSMETTAAAKDPASEPTTAVPVQESSMATSVRAVGGEVTHERALAAAPGRARDWAAVIKAAATEVKALAKHAVRRLQAVTAPLRDRLESLLP